MPKPATDPTIIDMRRARVAQLKLRGLSSREITLALAKGDNKGNGKILNPNNGNPYDHVTILRDLEVLRGEWRQERLQNTDTHIDRQFTEIQEVKRAAWATSDPKLALEALDREMKLLGTMKPTQINFTFDVEVVMRLVEVIELRGENPTTFFMEMIQEFMDADSEEVQAAEKIINAHSHADP